ncbi:MAG: AbrB/MazE/SpoVT family DNA-binding domain-containing protein [Desulfurivibrionaceae bacterium]
MIAIAKITSKGQTTVPRDIRALLHIKPGDLISWEETENGAVQVKRVQPSDVEYLRAVEGTLGEWASPADEEAYRDL